MDRESNCCPDTRNNSLQNRAPERHPVHSARCNDGGPVAYPDSSTRISPVGSPIVTPKLMCWFSKEDPSETTNNGSSGVKAWRIPITCSYGIIQRTLDSSSCIQWSSNVMCSENGRIHCLSLSFSKNYNLVIKCLS